MPELHLTILFRFILLLFAAVCSMLVSLFVYRSTVPPVSTVKRYTLISLRSGGLFLLFLLLGEPLISLMTHSLDQPVIAVLVDDSQSMAISDLKGERDKTLKSILHDDVWKKIGKNERVEYFLFNSKVRRVVSITDDSLTCKGEATDIAEALKSVKQNCQSSNLQAVALLTDGNSTTGMSPLYEAQELAVPVFTIGVGDTTEQKDLVIRKALTNEIAYAGAKVPVNVTVHSTGFGGERVLVSLHEGAAILDEKPLVLEGGMRDYLVPLSFVAEKEGIQKFTAEVSTLPGELTPKNNHLSFYMKVLKSKMRVALIAGSPSQDAAFIRRGLMSDKNDEISSFIEKSDGTFYENMLNAEALKAVDCLVLVGFPTAHSNSHSLQTVVDAGLSEKPFLIIMSRNIDYGKLHMLDPFLPFSVENPTGNELQVFAAVPETQRNSSILKIDGSTNTIELWSKLPPVFRMQGSFRSKIESEILATARFQSTPLGEPFIVARNVNKQKSLAVLGYGLWRWNMLSDAGSGTDQVLEHFLGNTVRWLTTQEDSRRIRVQSSSHVFTTQDAVEFTAQVYDEKYQPLDDAQVEVHVQSGSETRSLALSALGSGQYRGEIESLGEGEYMFTARVSVDGAVLGNDQGSFSVGGLNAEFLETRMNKSLLQQIAEETGGRYFDSDNINSLADDLATIPNFKSRDVSTSADIEIWNSRWMLACVILIFAVEWFMRKRNGML